MKNLSLRVIFILLLGIILNCMPAPAQTREDAEESLNNASVIKLVRAGFKDKTVIAIIRTRPTRFDLAPDRLIELKHNGVSENVILAMLARDNSGGMTFENLDNDSFFGDSSGPVNSGKTKKQGEGKNGSTDIFGSSGGSSGRTKSRGANGSNDNDTNMTGSATVRIIRPPVEPGGAPKLEKTPTLTNDSIIELVEAGFTEGTIIRRIELSPAEFDLTPPKMAELRRRRVSDKIIAAMKTAMSDDATP